MIQIDMEMPKTCDDCPFHIYHSGKNYVCVATPLFYPMNLANYKDGRKDFCPLKEVSQEPVLNKIREQMKDYLRGVEITLEVLIENDPLRPKMEGAKSTLEECLELIDKAESEETDGNNYI